MNKLNLARVSNGVLKSVGLHGWRRNVSGAPGVFRIGGRVESPGEPIVLREFQAFTLEENTARGFVSAAVLVEREVHDSVKNLVDSDAWTSWLTEVNGFRSNRRVLWVFTEEGLSVRRNKVAAEVGMVIAEVLLDNGLIKTPT